MIGRFRKGLSNLSRFGVAVILLFLGTALAHAAPVKILAIGSSLTQGYGLPPGTEMTALLTAKFKAAGMDIRFINAGVSGDTSAGGLSRLDWSLADKPDAVWVELGSNDALRGVPPSVTEKNLDAILAKLKAAKIPTLLIGMLSPRNLGPDYVRQFDAIYPKLAKKYGVIFYPFILDGVATNPKLNQADMMHPNPAGSRVIADKLFPYVKRLVEQVGAKK
jgi:acyl-CoA thioesterase-1